MKQLRQIDCGCTSGHDSLIRLWVPEPECSCSIVA